MNNLTKKAFKGTKTTSKQATRFASDEALEFLNTGKKQVAGSSVEKIASNGTQQRTDQSSESKAQNEQELARLKAQSKRQIETLEREIDDIIRQKQEKDRQKLLAEEAEKQRLAEAGMSTGLVEPQTKRKRGVLKGMKGKVDKMKKKTEMRSPPSG